MLMHLRGKDWDGLGESRGFEERKAEVQLEARQIGLKRQRLLVVIDRVCIMLLTRLQQPQMSQSLCILWVSRYD